MAPPAIVMRKAKGPMPEGPHLLVPLVTGIRQQRQAGQEMDGHLAGSGLSGRSISKWWHCARAACVSVPRKISIMPMAFCVVLWFN